MFRRENNFAFIDSNNLYQSLSKDIYKKDRKIYSGWQLGYKRFRIYLKDKYSVDTAYLFVGYKPGNQAMYTALQEFGYICIFKPTLELADGTVKGNVDAELVLHSMIEYDNYDKAVIVSGDGDFYCLIEHFINHDKLKKVLIPNQNNYSCLLDRLSTPANNILAYINVLKNKLEYKKNK